MTRRAVFNEAGVLDDGIGPIGVPLPDPSAEPDGSWLRTVGGAAVWVPTVDASEIEYAGGTDLPVDNVQEAIEYLESLIGGAGVSSLAKSGDTPLTGDVTLSEGANVTLTQVGNDIEIAASGSGGGGIGASELIYRYTVSGTDKASIDTGVDTPDAGSNDWTDGDMLEIVIKSRTDDTGTNVGLTLNFNNDTGANYERAYITMTNATVAGANELTATRLNLNSLGGGSAANVFAATRIEIPDFTNTANHKTFTYQEAAPDNAAASARTLAAAGCYRSTSALARVAVAPLTAGKKLKVGTQVLIYKRLRS